MLGGRAELLDDRQDFLDQRGYALSRFPGHLVGKGGRAPQECFLVDFMPDGKDLRLAALNLKGDEPVEIGRASCRERV